MARVMVLTQDAQLFQVIREGFAPATPARDVELLGKTEEAVARLCNPELAKAHIAFVDVSTIGDGNRFIDFIRSSPSTRHLQVVAITDDPQGQVAPPNPAQAATHVLGKPILVKEISKIAEALRLQQGG